MEYQEKYDKLIKMVTEDIEIDDKVYNLSDDVDKFFVKGNKAAGGRIRKVMQALKGLAQEIRVDVQEYKSKL